MNTESFIATIITFLFVLWSWLAYEVFSDFKNFNKVMQILSTLWFLFVVGLLIYIKIKNI